MDWTMIDNEEPFDDTEAEERDWIAVQLPIPADAALDAQVLHRAMRILRELVAMDMPGGLTVECPRAPEWSGELVRARVAPPWEAQENDGGCPDSGGQHRSGARKAKSKERAIVAHTTHRVRQRLRETG